MKLLVLGATGGIGSQVAAQALAAGHTVTALVRRPEALTVRHQALCVVKGDALDAEAMTKAAAGQEAVVSALGAHGRGPTRLYSQGVGNVLAAMAAGGAQRLVCVSATGLEPGPLWQRLIAKPILWALFKEMYSDLVRMEAAVRASVVDWTILRPPRLTDGPHTGRYRTAVNAHLPNCLLISRADVADYILRVLTTGEASRALVEVAY